MTGKDHTLPTAQEESTHGDDSIVPDLNIFGSSGAPPSVDDLPGTPVTEELTLLDPEPVGSGVISHREHGKHLFGAIRAELSSEELYTRFMRHMWPELVKSFYILFNQEYGRERINRRFLSNLGITEPEDALTVEGQRSLVNRLWNEFVETGNFARSWRYDRLLAEEAVSFGAVDMSYLRQLPTETEYHEDRHGRSEVAVDKTRESKINRHQKARRESEQSADWSVSPHVHPDLDLLEDPADLADDILSIARYRLSENRLHGEFLQRLCSITLGQFTIDMKREYCPVANYSELSNLGFHEPEACFDKERLATALTDVKNFYLSNHRNVGSCPAFSIMDLAEDLNIISRRECREFEHRRSNCE